MKKVIIIFGFLITIFGYGQDCKYKRNEIDEFTKSKILETKSELLTISGMGFGFSSSVSFKKVDNQRYLKLAITSPSVFSIRKDDKIMFKTNAETSIELSFVETIISDYISGTRIGTSTTPSTHKAMIIIPLSNSELERLYTEDILKARIHTSDGYIDDDVKSKRAKKIKEYAKCIE